MPRPSQSVGTTLTGGIQDISALLPLLGTDQCETHVGSALDGGYLYAAAAPMSIFGSLGIVKIGISVLISSISIPKLSISYRPFCIKSSQDRWLGARTLDNAGFKPAGTVAAMIAMDGTRYKAETRLMQILEEKHLDNPENLSIEWKSREWNVALVLFTIVAGVISGTPYIALLLRNFPPTVVHTPWIFPLLRTVGSCLAAICCQFLIQYRIIALMKSRIVLLIMHRVLVDDLKSKHNKLELDLGLKAQLRWDVDLPAEQCLSRLERFLSSQGSFNLPSEGPKEKRAHVSIPMNTLSFSKPEEIRSKLRELCDEHFPTPAFDRAFVLVAWIILCISLPATVAGYIGCFTLVSGSQDNGPLIWLGLEASLSTIRILVWAWNPSWDEKTNIIVKLKLTKDQPLITTEKSVEVIAFTGNHTLALIPERQFLEWITPYTGPMEQFRSPENLALYFTLTAGGRGRKCLYMTIFDFNKRIGVTLVQEEDVLKCIDATVTYNRIASEMEAIFQSDIDEKHPWRTNNPMLFDALVEYYRAVTHTLNRAHSAADNLQSNPIANLPWKWDLVPKHTESDDRSPNQVLAPSSMTAHDQLYLRRGDEHELKTLLIQNWSEWIVEDMGYMRQDARNDCYQALADASSEKAIWELTELDFQLAWEWTRRELSLVVSSITLEGILHQRMKECIEKVTGEQENRRLKDWMWSEFVIGQRKRLEKERAQTEGRMVKEMKNASDLADSEGRPWRDQGVFLPVWEEGLEFIDRQWSAGIERGQSGLDHAVHILDQLVKENTPFPPGPWGSTAAKNRFTILNQVKQRFERWHPQRENERREMDTTIKGIWDADSEHLYDAYHYPESDSQGTLRFVNLQKSESQGRVCSATVYDVEGCEKDAIFDVIKKSTTRSVVGVDPDLVDSIPENEHLLYIGSFPVKDFQEPAFIQRNRDRWWDQQTSNSSTFYFSSGVIGSDGHFVFSKNVTIAHIFIFLITPSRLRLRLLHQSRRISVSIKENGKELRRISTNEIPNNLQLQDFELDEFEPGRHEVELVPTRSEDLFAYYGLRDILIEFFDDTPLRSSGGQGPKQVPRMLKSCLQVRAQTKESRK